MFRKYFALTEYLRPGKGAFRNHVIAKSGIPQHWQQGFAPMRNLYIPYRLTTAHHLEHDSYGNAFPCSDPSTTKPKLRGTGSRPSPQQLELFSENNLDEHCSNPINAIRRILLNFTKPSVRGYSYNGTAGFSKLLYPHHSSPISHTSHK